MDIQELDVALDELESRLDRLRSLYEQYFLGIEKIEPSIARKDVDRRFWILRRTKIRNTARRFRMQLLIQRYNTFQQYWSRICREIENGTYVRHLLKVQKKLGEEPMTWAAKKRLGLLRRAKPGPTETESADPGAGNDDPELGNLLDGNADLVAEATRAAASAVANVEKQRSVRPPAPVRAALTLEDLGPLDLDFDDEDELPPPAKKAVPAVPSPGAARPASPPSEAPTRPMAARQGMPLPGRPAGAPAAAQKSTVAGPARPVPPMAAASPSLAATRAPAPADGWDRLAAAAPDRSKPLERLQAATGMAPAQPPAVAAAERPKASSPGAGSALSDDRVRVLHAELVAARRNLKQGDTVSVDSLARSLRDTEQKLRLQHQGRNVDFQIVVKDGKPVVKPIVRK